MTSTPPRRITTPGALQRVAPDQVENHIGILDFVLELFRCIINDFLRPETAQEVKIPCRGRCNHQSTLPPGQLYRKRADAAGCTMN